MKERRMATNRDFDAVCAEWLKLVDTYSVAPPPPMLNTGQRQSIAHLIEELGERVYPYMRWCCQNWKRVERDLEDGNFHVPRDPRLGILVQFLDRLSHLAGQDRVFGYKADRQIGGGYSVARPVREEATNGNGGSAIISGGPPLSDDEIAEGAARALGG